MRYEVVVAGTVVGTYTNKVEAENRLYEIHIQEIACLSEKSDKHCKKEVDKFNPKCYNNIIKRGLKRR